MTWKCFSFISSNLEETLIILSLEAQEQLNVLSTSFLKLPLGLRTDVKKRSPLESTFSFACYIFFFMQKKIHKSVLNFIANTLRVTRTSFNFEHNVQNARDTRAIYKKLVISKYPLINANQTDFGHIVENHAHN